MVTTWSARTRPANTLPAGNRHTKPSRFVGFLDPGEHGCASTSSCAAAGFALGAASPTARNSGDPAAGTALTGAGLGGAGLGGPALGSAGLDDAGAADAAVPGPGS